MLNRRPFYYTWRTLLSLALLFAGFALLLLESPAGLLSGAAVVAFGIGQVGFLTHDAGHGAIFATSRWNRLFCLITGAIIGVSSTWWTTKHNLHHRRPNQLGVDPDVALPLICLGEAQLLSRRGWRRQVVRGQAFLLPGLLLGQAVAMRVASMRNALGLAGSAPVPAEIALLVLHHVLFLGAALVLLGPAGGVTFLILVNGLTGLYVGSVFAANHKGMKLLDMKDSLDFLTQQVVTTRNVAPGRFNDFWCGGLNLQIEHHLFPSMPRCNLSKARPIIHRFCSARSIDYHETGLLAAYAEVLRHLQHVSRQAGNKRVG